VRAKKEGQQEHRNQHIQSIPDRKLPMLDARKADAGQKGSKEGMDADFVSGCGGNEHTRNSQAEKFKRKVRIVASPYEPCR
jgi:hypothetical protein